MRTTEDIREGFYLSDDGEWIPDGWIETTLGTITDWSSGGTPSKANSYFWKGSIPWISATSMTGKYIGDSELKITEEAVKTGSRVAKQGTMLFLVRGSGLYNNISFGLTTRDVAFNQDVKSFTSKDPRVSHELLYYLLMGKLRELRFLLEDTGIGAGKFDSERLRNLKLIFPDGETERSELLKTCKCLDDKIELLREQNETLEALAQTLFKRWFIDFNFPDENGKPYKDSGGVMIASELGGIPVGWEVFRLGTFFDLKSGHAFKGNEFTESSNNRVIKIKDLKGGGIIDSSNLSAVTDEAKKNKRAQSFRLKVTDVLVAMSGNTTGKIGVFTDTENTVYLNQRVGKFFQKGRLKNGFLKAFLFSGGFEKRILEMGYGSAQPNINPTQVHEIKICLPAVIHELESEFEHLLVKTVSNTQQIETLTQLRDTLLPKLMKGEIRVSIES